MVWSALKSPSFAGKSSSQPISFNPKKNITSPHEGINDQSQKDKKYSHLKIPAISLVAFPSAQPAMFR